MSKELLGELELNRIYQRDCLSDGGIALIPDKSIDMILCDLPYGTTNCRWDTILPFDKLWEQYERVIKDNGAIVLTASQPFTSALGASNLDLLKYAWVWEKSNVGDVFNAKNKPMKKHEDILVFSKGTTANGSDKRMVYNPQGLKPTNIKRTDKDNAYREGGGAFKNYRPSHKSYEQKFTGYPNTVLSFKSEKCTYHPTQKPVALFEYLIRTYTNDNAIILDNCIGSGTTAVATLQVGGGRRFIGFETEREYVEIANQRIESIREELDDE